MDLERAVALIESRGTLIDRARIRCVVHGESPGPGIVTHLSSHQDPGGGFRYGWTGWGGGAGPGPVSVADTLNAMWWMDDLGLLGSRTAAMAVEFLRRCQLADGGWDEFSEVAPLGPPPWAVPGEIGARTFLTAYAAYWLGRTGARGSLRVERAIGFLEGQIRDDGWYTGFPHNTWIATAAVALEHGPDSPPVERGLAALDERPIGDWVDSQLAWALDCLGSAGIGPDRPFVGRAGGELVGRQAPDGSWASEDGEAFVVSGTIGAVKALAVLGMLPGVDPPIGDAARPDRGTPTGGIGGAPGPEAL